ncbi:MAG: hypothetical protein JO025_11720 [Verrucomicrobia bacterium]|nr:hypothetical protein [Verrucomicrobiota bacterium]
MLPRVRKLLALVFLIAISLVGSVANPSPTPTQRPLPLAIGKSPSNDPRPASTKISLLRSWTVIRGVKSAVPPRPDVFRVLLSQTRSLSLQNSIAPTLQYSVTPPPIHSSTVYEESPVPNQADLNDSYDVFYHQLSADGHWLFAENFGYVYQPKVAEKDPNWRPYTNGHWEATDRGWYWDTDEPFGWATYHYGRWANIDGTGWVWTPGIDWSPAWVSWRICDNGFVGWAPLPPECPRPSDAVPIGSWCDSYADIGPEAFCFLPFNAWFKPSYVGLFAPASQNRELINASRNVTNISASKTTISDFGPRPDFIAQETGQEVKTYQLHYSEVRGQHNFSRSINGNLLNVEGPAVKLKANATKVPTVIKTIVRPAVNKGWNGLTKEDIDGVHQKYASEAHIPRHLPNKPIERVNLVPSATPAVARSASDQKQKEPKEHKATANASPQKETKEKTATASAHKKTAKHKTASESEDESGSKGESKSKVKSKTAKASKETQDTDESKTPNKKTAKSGSAKSDGQSKSTKTSKSSGGSKGEDSGAEGSKSSTGSKDEGSKSGSKKSSNGEDSRGDGSKKSGSSKREGPKSESTSEGPKRSQKKSSDEKD